MTTQRDEAASKPWALPPEGARGPRRLIARWRSQPGSAAEAASSGFARADYLDAVEKIAGFFAGCQVGSGAVVDPYRKVEFQYSTPCFAYAAALLATARGRTDLLEPACKAMDWAVHGLTTRTAATRHEDFYPSPLAHALRLLEPIVDQLRVWSWRETLRRMNPFAIYRYPIGGQGPGPNWNCIAAAGEYLLHRIGARDDPAFTERSLSAQARLFNNNELGMYAEGPLVYDAFPRAWLGDMLSNGYAGPRLADLSEMFDRGSLASLLLQSPTGELPCGGRSSHHQWADAVQTLIFEIAGARALRVGDAVLAGVFKRAARRAYAAILPWQRSSGEFWVVKNKSDPALRHGYETYTSHSQYNLLTATILGYAYERAESSEALAERTTPAETGGFVAVLPHPFHKVVAAAAGTQVIVCTKPDPRQTPAGLVRVHFAGMQSALGPSDGLLQETAYALPQGPRTDVSIGLAWATPQGRIASLSGQRLSSLAGIARDRISVAITIGREEPGDIRFRIEYRLLGEPVSRISETYQITAGTVAVLYNMPGSDHAALLRWPVFAGDGTEAAKIALGRDRIAVAFAGNGIRYLVDGAGPIRLSPRDYPHRNGFVRIAEAEKPAGSPLRLFIRRD